jgi:RecB family endonuclease NucS
MPHFTTTSGKRIEITREQVLEGMKTFDEMAEKDDDLSRAGRIYFVENDGRRYPPKWVVSLASSVERKEFNGGDNVNRPLSELKFTIGKIDEPNEKQDEQVVDAIKTTFTLERDLELALRSNIEQLESGLRIMDGGIQKKVESGYIDILAVDRNGSAVVIELKAGEANRDAIGQILAYMGDLRRDAKMIRGILVAGDFNSRLIAAASVVPNIELRKYGFKFSFELVKQREAVV